MIAVPNLRRRKVAAITTDAANLTARQSVVDVVPAYGITETIDTHALKVDRGVFPSTTPPAYSQFQPIKGGPVLRAYIRPWLWAWNHHRLDSNQTKVEGRDTNATAGGSTQRPRSRFTKVLNVPSYTTKPPGENPT